MKIRKISGSVAAAVAMLSLNGVAVADHSALCASVLSERMKLQVKEIVCSDDDTQAALGYTGYWPTNTPLWQFKAGKAKGKSSTEETSGCTVHAKMAQLIYAKRDPYDDASKPKRNHKGSNDAKGAANALDNLNFDVAVSSLEEFKLILDASVPNPDFDTHKDMNAEQWIDAMKTGADTWIAEIKACGHIVD